MSTPIGHALLAGSMYFGSGKSLGWDWRKLAFFAFSANAPDLDVIPGLLVGDISQFHRYPSHSFLAGALFVVPAIIVVKGLFKWFPNESYLRLAVVGFLLFVSHLVLDLFTLDNGFPIGIPLFWPLSDVFISAPFYFIPNVLHSSNLIGLHNLNVVLLELLLFIPPLLYLAFGNRWLPGRTYKVGSVAITLLVGLILLVLAKENPYF